MKKKVMKKYASLTAMAAICALFTACIFQWDCFYSDGAIDSYAHFSNAEAVGIKYVAYMPFYTPGEERTSDSEVRNYHVLVETNASGPEIIKSLAHMASFSVDSILWLREDLSIAAVWDLAADTADDANRWLDAEAWTTDTVYKPVCNNITLTEFHHTFTFRPEDVR